MNSQESSSYSITPGESISITTNTASTIEPPKPNSARTATCWNFFHYPADSSVKTVKCYITRSSSFSTPMKKIKTLLSHL